MIQGAKSEDVISALERLLRSLRLKVKEIALDLSLAMYLIANKSFPKATLAADRFHVRRLVHEAISDLRIDYRWQAIDLENRKSN